MKRLLFIFVLLLFCNIQKVYSTHLMGGSMTYVFLDQNGPPSAPNRYRVNIKIYRDCGPTSQADFDNFLNLGIYNNDAQKTLYATDTIQGFVRTSIDPPGSSSCGFAPNVCIQEGRYSKIINLPNSFAGYHITYVRCCRNDAILNLDPQMGQTYYAFIPATNKKNSSPDFNDFPVPYICTNDTGSILNTATDIDGDKLLFFLTNVTPYNGGSATAPSPFPSNPMNWPIPTVTYANGYSPALPFGSGGLASVDIGTGLTKFMAPTQGFYVVAVEIQEFRNDVLLTTTRRDMQIIVIDCPPNPAPNLATTGGSGITTYTITEGESISFPLTFTDADSLFLTRSGSIFDSNQTIPSAVLNEVTGIGSITSNFSWQTACGMGKSQPYFFTVAVSDNGCPPKGTNVVYTINVKPFPNPPEILGLDTVCANETGVSYSVLGSSGSTFNWEITNGTQSTGSSTSSITVDWGNTATGLVEVTETSVNGCIGSKLSLPITLKAAPIPDAGIDISLCPEETGNIGSDTLAEMDYLWTPTAGLSSTIISNPSISLPNNTLNENVTNYVVQVTSQISGCAATDTVKVRIKPNPISEAGVDAATCSAVSITIGTATTTDYSYSWVSATNLSSTTVADPVVTATNTSATNDTLIYTVFTTLEGCTTSDSLQVIIKPIPISEAGQNQNFCSGASATLGTTATNGYTYDWSPIEGISQVNSSNPTVTLVNDSTFKDTIMYYVTTTHQGCVSMDSTQVTVRPLPKTDAGADTNFCSGNPMQIGTTALTNYTYAWSPSKGLNDTTLAQPTINLINISPTDSFFYYVVTATLEGCTKKDSLLIKVKPYPTPDAGIDVSFCSGGSAGLSASFNSEWSYAWSPNIGLNDSSIYNPIVSLINTNEIPDSLYYVVTATRSGCATSDSLQVVVRPYPIPDAGVDQEFCSLQGASLGAASKSGYTYSWSPSTGVSDTSLADPAINLSNIGTVNDTSLYIVTATVFACSKADTLQVVVKPYPISEAGEDTTFCSEDTILIGVISKPNHVYSWSPANGLSTDTVSNPLISLNNNSQKEDTLAYYVVTTLAGCPTTDSVRIIVKHYPIANAGGLVGLCSEDSMVVGTASTAGYTYSWLPDSGLSSSTISDPMLSLVNQGLAYDTAHYVVSTNRKNCISYDTLTAIVFPVPVTPKINGSVSVCPGVTNVSYWLENATSNSSYTWFLNGIGSIASGQGTDSIIVNWGPSGEGVISVVERDSTDCIGDTLTFPVRINVILYPPVPMGEDTLCTLDLRTKLYRVVYTNGSTYTWHIEGGTITGGNGSNNILVNWDSLYALPHILWYEEFSVTNDTVCYGISDTLIVTIFESPQKINIVGDFSLCEKTVDVIYTASGFSGSTFLWTVDSALSTQTLSNDSISVDWGSVISGKIQLIETTNEGCVGNPVDSIVILHPLPTTSALLGDTIICLPTFKPFVYSVNGFGNSVYDWNLVPPLGTFENPQRNDSINIDWTDLGKTKLSVSETTQFGCSSGSVSLNISVHQPTLELLSVSVSQIENDQVDLNWKSRDLSSISDTIYLNHSNLDTLVWKNFAQVKKELNTFSDTSVNPDLYYNHYRILSKDICQRPIKSKVHNSILLEANKIERQVSSSLSLKWNPYEGWKFGVRQYEIWRKLDDQDSYTYLTMSFPDTAIQLNNGEDGFKHCFVIKAYEELGNGMVSYSNTQCIIFNHSISISNAFTPNGDSKNDVWVIPKIHLYPKNEIVIFNQWGNEVYAKKGYNNDWDGGGLPVGTYYYILNLNNGSEVKKGFITIVR